MTADRDVPSCPCAQDAPADEWRKYHELTDREVRRHMETMFTDEYRAGFSITELARLGDGWIVKWERNLLDRSASRLA